MNIFFIYVLCLIEFEDFNIWLFEQNLGYDDVYSDCYPLVENSSYLLNPCGLVANTFFNGNSTHTFLF